MIRGLCGFFYHDIFPYLSVMQFGGKYPWWDGSIEVECPDRYNTVSLKIERKDELVRKSLTIAMASVFLDNGIVIMLEACFFFAVFDSLTKYLVDSFTMGEIVFVRFCFGAVMMFPSLLRQRLGIRRKDFFLLMLRGLSGAGTFYLTLLAFQSGALSVTMVLFFTSPLWALFMGALFLEEHLTGKESYVSSRPSLE